MSSTVRPLVAVMLATGLGIANAQSWPAKPVRVIVTQAPGSAPDVIARFVLDKLSRSLGQSVIVDNRPGGVNVIGMQAAARSAPDGYTLLFATSAGLTTNVYTIKGLPYDPVKDFLPVALIAKGPFVLAANAKLPVRSFADLVALDKSKPGEFSAAVDGPRFLTGMIMTYMNKVTGTSFVQVPYNNILQGAQDTAMGQAQVTLQAPAVIDGFLRRGELRALAVTSASRVPSMPDVPALAETYPGFDFNGWFMLLAPAGTPPEIAQRVNREMDRVLKEEETRQRLLTFAFFTDGAQTLPELGSFLRSELATWERVVRTIGVEPE